MEKYSRDTICFVNKQIFGDEEEHQIEMEFFDGYAISLDHRYGLTYPMLKHLSKSMRNEVEDYTGRELESPFDIALMYSKPFLLPQNERGKKDEKEHDYLMSLLTERQLDEYVQYCDSLEAREYFLVYLDTQTDCGINFWYGGTFYNADDAEEALRQFMSGAKQYNEYHETYQYVKNELNIDSNARIERVFFTEQHGEPNGEFYYLISRPMDDADEVVMVWNRNNLSKFNENEIKFFTRNIDASMYAAAAKVREFSDTSEIETFGICWYMEEIKSFDNLKTLFPSFNIWGNDGYNVHIIHGKYKE